MKKGGQIIYSGSLGSLSRNMIQYFEVTMADFECIFGGWRQKH
jgi:hypothetical protein